MSAHDVVVLTAPDAPGAAARAARIGALLGGGVQVIGVADPDRLGNLHGTLTAWRTVRDEVPADARVAIVHDAGRATRTFPLSGGGTRGALRLGARVGGREADLLGAVVAGARPFATTADAVDVFWGSQLLVPTALGPRRGELCKLVRVDVHRPRPDEVTDLGCFGLGEDDGVLGFAPRATFADADGLLAWAAAFPRRAADVGSSSLTRRLLDDLADHYAGLPARPRDLDPELTAPWLRALAGAPAEGPGDDEVRALLARHPRLARRDALVARRFEGRWVRLRRPAEIRRALLAALDDPGLRAVLGVAHPVERTWLGSRWIEGPELGWDEVAAGVEVDGVRLRRAVVRDSALAAGSRVEDAWVHATRGAVRATGSVVLDVAADPLEAREAVLHGVVVAGPLRAAGEAVGGSAPGQVVRRPLGDDGG